MQRETSEIHTLRFETDPSQAAPSWRCMRSPDDAFAAECPLPPSPDLVGYAPPRSLYVRGRPDAFELLGELPERGLAVVGTRRPQPRSLALVRSTLGRLSKNRLIVLSGLALGVDAAAHEAAMAARLPTIALLASPLEEIYPPENRALARTIVARGGLLITELAPGSEMKPHFFLLRNRLIASWSKATWIVEAACRSGALNTARWSHEQDRDTYATPCYPEDPALAGNQGLLAREKAYPFWDAKSLMHTWPRLHVSRGAGLQADGLVYNDDSPLGNDAAVISDAKQLVRRVTAASQRDGGVPVDGLLRWAMALGWNPQRFFDTLRLSLQRDWVADRDGFLCAPGARRRGG